MSEPVIVARPQSQRFVSFLLATIAVLAVVAGMYWYKYNAMSAQLAVKSAAITVPAIPATAQSATIATPTPPQAPTLEERLKPATVGKGEGIEHSFIRQLKADPKTYGFKGDLKDQEAVKRWAGGEAHRIAIKLGFFDAKYGAQIGVKAPDDVAFLLGKDGNDKTTVSVYTDMGNSNHFEETNTSGSTFPPANAFLGWPGANHTIPPYLFLYTG